MKTARLARIGVLALAAVALSGCACPCAGGKAKHVQHVVVMWLKERGNQAARQQIIETSLGFSQIPGVLSVSAGAVLPSERPIVDSSFDVAIVVRLEDADAMRAYLEHPIHKRAAAEILPPLVSKILVYDFTE